MPRRPNRRRARKLALAWRATAVWLAMGANAQAQAPARVDVSVDATVAGTPLERIWPYHGYDEVNYTTTAEGQALLKTLGTIHGTAPYVRAHFLLNTGNGAASLKWGSTNAYTEDAGGNPVYDWKLVDGIMDGILGAGALPFNEIAFMPQALSTRPTPYQNTSTYALDGGCFYPPKDYGKWGALITEWATHAKARYPGSVDAWIWELWNEPDIDYWQGTFAEFARLYDYTEAAIRKVLPNAVVGGPSVASAGSFFTQFLQHCATGTNAVSGQPGARLDLISFHAKGGAAIVSGHVQLNLGNQLRLHRTGFSAVAAIPAFKQTPIVVSEADPDGCAACPVSMGHPEDAYRNSPAYGAYEVAMMKRSLEQEVVHGVKLQGLTTWAFTFPSSPYFAGYRALATNGIHLPVLNAFKLLGSLAGNRLPVTSSGALTLNAILANSVRSQADVDAMATQSGQKIQVLVWNYHDDLVAAAASPVRLSVKVPGSFGSAATVSHLRVDETHGDAYTVWVSQGSPAAPSATQIAALRAAMEPTSLEPARSVAVAGGAVGVDFDLPRFGISLVTLVPAAAAGDGGTPDAPAGTDAGVDAGPGDRPADMGATGGGGAGGHSDAAAGGAGGASAGGSGGAGASGGMGAAAGTAGAAGASGSPGTAGSTGMAGSSGSAGSVGTAGSTGSAGSTGTAGAAGAAGVAGTAGGAGTTPPRKDAGGCGCDVGSHGAGSGPEILAFMILLGLGLGRLRGGRARDDAVAQMGRERTVGRG